MERNIWFFISLLVSLNFATVVLANEKTEWEVLWEAKVRALSQAELAVNAMQEFKSAFAKFREENDLDSVESFKEELLAYYTNEYGKEYAERNDGEMPDINALFGPLDDDSIALQHYYISANPHPLGAKDQLERADDKSSWSALHAKYHSQFHTYLEEEGLYDLFLVDIDSGDIIYSVFKELDFTTSLLDGPYSKTNFADAFRAVKESDDKDFALMVFFQPYLPSYEDPAYFIAAPIYSGDDKIGALIMQLPL
jgi:hypothetical protein